MMVFAKFLVGGFVRDDLMGFPSKDVDFVVIAESFAAMRAHLVDEGFRIHTEKEEFTTIRAGVPEGHPLRVHAKDADFVLGRKDGPTADGRRPVSVSAGTLEEDLARRDFTVNAMARTVDGRLIDPHNGRADIETRTLRFVGDPVERISEDGLRVIRGFRFMATRGLQPTPETLEALTRPLAVEMLAKVSKERIRDEVHAMFSQATRAAMRVSRLMPEEMEDLIFNEEDERPIRLVATMAK